MTLKELVENMTPGGLVSVLVIISLLIQISPLKLDPWSWIGDQLNKNIKRDMNSRIDGVEKNISCIDEKLNSHMVESYRTVILDFADSVMHSTLYTHDKWRQVLKICAIYESFVSANHLINGDATEAIEYLREEYQRCCQAGNFSDFPRKKQ